MNKRYYINKGYYTGSPGCSINFKLGYARCAFEEKNPPTEG